MHILHRDDMSMGVRHVEAGEEHRHPLDPIDLLLPPSDHLADRHDAGGERRREVLEPDVMGAGNDQRVSGADRMEVEEGHRLVVLMDDMGRQLACGDAAEQADVRHSARPLGASQQRDPQTAEGEA